MCVYIYIERERESLQENGLYNSFLSSAHFSAPRDMSEPAGVPHAGLEQAAEFWNRAGVQNPEPLNFGM